MQSKLIVIQQNTFQV